MRGARPASGGDSVARGGHTTGQAPQRIPVGGNVQASRLIKKVDPVYPAELRQGITGTVMVRAVISTTGEMLNPEVISTTVNPGLAQAALEAVRIQLTGMERAVSKHPASERAVHVVPSTGR